MATDASDPTTCAGAEPSSTLSDAAKSSDRHGQGAPSVARMHVLRVRGFAPLLASEAINAIGNWIAVIAIWGFAAFAFDADAGDLALLFVVLSLPGAVLGGLFVGLSEALAGRYLPDGVKDLTAYALMLGVLLLFPRGLGEAGRPR